MNLPQNTSASKVVDITLYFKLNRLICFKRIPIYLIGLNVQLTIFVINAKEIIMEKVTAGRDALGSFAPKFAELNDDVLFGEVWSREDKLSLRDRSIVTVIALMSSGVLDSSLQYHIKKAKENGVTKEEMAEILTHAAFYAGWPKAWAAFRMAKEVYID